MVALLKDGKVIGETAQEGGNNEWFTPSRYIEAAREVMGGIDLDPASCAEANSIVRATRYFTKEENGLLQEWRANSLWLNPPYGLTTSRHYGSRFHGGGSSPEKKSLQSMFIDKALREYKARNVEQMMLLVTANTTVKWFQPLWDYPMCTPFPKIGFIVPGLSERQRQVFGNVFVYLGPHEQKFISLFSQFGRITRAIDTSPKTFVPLSLWEVAEW